MPVAAICSLWVAATAQGPQATLPPLVVDYDQERNTLSVTAEDHRFTEIMSSVADATGIEIIVTAANVVDEEMRMTLERVPLEEGLKALLKGKSYAMASSGDGAKTLWVLSDLNATPPSETPMHADREAVDITEVQARGHVDLSEAERASIREQLRRYETAFGKDPREELEHLREQFAPAQPSFFELSADEIPDALVDMVIWGAPAAPPFQGQE